MRRFRALSFFILSVSLVWPFSARAAMPLAAEPCPPLILPSQPRQIIFVNGSGFSSTTTATVDGIPALSSHLDSQCCAVQLPDLAMGTHAVVLSTGGSSVTATINAVNSPGTAFLVSCLKAEIVTLESQGVIPADAANQIVKPLGRALHDLEIGQIKPAHHELSVNYLHDESEFAGEISIPVHDGLRGAMYNTILPVFFREFQEQDPLKDERADAKKKVTDAKNKALEAALATPGSVLAGAINTLATDADGQIDKAKTKSQIDLLVDAFVEDIGHYRLLASEDEAVCKCQIKISLSGATEDQATGEPAPDGDFESAQEEVTGTWGVNFFRATTTQLTINIACPMNVTELDLDKIEATSTCGAAGQKVTGAFVGAGKNTSTAANKWKSTGIGALDSIAALNKCGVGDWIEMCFFWTHKVEGKKRKCKWCYILRLVE